MRPRAYLDAGHSGPWPADPGACAPSGERESALVLPFARALGHYLQVSRHEVVHSRLDELTETMPLSERSRSCNRLGCDYLVSIHCNAGPSSATGFEIYTTPGQNRSDLLAEEIAKACANLHPSGVRADNRDGDLDREQHLKVLREARCPAVLLELGFLTHPGDLARMQDPAWTDRAALLVAGAIDRFCRVTWPEFASRA